MKNHTSDLISVIVPICNVEKYLAQALDSIIGQTYRNLEIICINDGSTDGSLDIIEEYAKKDSRIVILDKENEGYGKSCNRGIDMAKGVWISIIEPDDWLEPDMYADMMEFASRFDDCIDIIKTPWFSVEKWDNPETQTEKPSTLAGRIPTSKKPFSLSEYPILIETHPAIWSAIYRKAFLNSKGIRFPEYPGAGWADNPFLINTLCQTDKIVYLDKPYYHYRTDLPGSTRNHKTEDAISRPFMRWLDMAELLNRLGVTDPRILQAHYLRGFNYINGAIYDDGWDNPIVQSCTKEVLGCMDKNLVLSYPKISGTRKRFFLEMTDQQGRISNRGRAGFLMQEAVYTLKSYGIKDLFIKYGKLKAQKKNLES